MIQAAQQEADVIIWDGGNNDFPFVRPDLEIVVVDPFRPGHEVVYHPGEMNVRRADIIVINKVGSAPPENVDQVAETVAALNPTATVVRARSAITVDDGERVRGSRVVVVEDGPTLTHGGMATGAGAEAARLFGAAEIVDPRPWAVGELRSVYQTVPSSRARSCPRWGTSPSSWPTWPPRSTPCPPTWCSSPPPSTSLGSSSLEKPLVRVGYELEELEEPRISTLVRGFARERGLLRSMR